MSTAQVSTIINLCTFAKAIGGTKLQECKGSLKQFMQAIETLVDI